MTVGRQAAGRLRGDDTQNVGAGGGARRLLTDVNGRAKQVCVIRRVGVDFLLLEGPGLLGAIDLATTSFLLRSHIITTSIPEGFKQPKHTHGIEMINITTFTDYCIQYPEFHCGEISLIPR